MPGFKTRIISTLLCDLAIIRGHAISVAVVDTGMRSYSDGKPTQKMPFVSGEKAEDNHGHGNHVAGTIAGDGSSSGGQYRGVAPDANTVGR